MGGVDRKVHSFRVFNAFLVLLLIIEHVYGGETEVTLSTFAYISR